ncbi:hypothetical protein [Nocardioides sp. MH1]|uniref:hypothetical protein n=1 Tax=Nocardioides sp. MH1 TaxID=3242490 RepID=UPI0035200B9A
MSVVQRGETPGGPTPNERRYQLAILVLLVVLLAVLFAPSIGLVWLVSAKNSAEDDLSKEKADNAAYAAGPEARDAAEKMLLEMTSYSYKDIDDEYSWLDNFASDALRKRYAQQIPKLKKIIKASQASAEGEVRQSAYNTIDDDTATVLAYVRQVLRTKGDKRGHVEDQWTTLKMVRQGDGWKIGDIDIATVPPVS